MRHQPQELGAHVSCQQAAQLADVTVKAVRSAISSGRLMAVRNRAGRVLIPRGSLEDWLDWVQARRGETSDPRLISFREAMEKAYCKRSSLYYHRSRGRLEVEKNRARRLLLVRESFEAWLAKLPKRMEELEGEYIPLAEMATLVGLRRDALYRAIKKGELSPTICRKPGCNRFYVIPMDQCQAWIKKRNSRFATAVKLKGEPLTLQEASQRTGRSADFLYQAIKNGELTARRQSYRGSAGFAYVTGAEDLAEFLAIRKSTDGWTLERLSRFTGFKEGTLWGWLKPLNLSARMGHKSWAKRRWGFLPEELGPWLEQHLPPYNSEVAPYPPTIDLEEAARLVVASGGTREQFQTALREEELDALRYGKRVVIARYAFDRWSRAQGWPPSATFTESPFITVARAVQLTGRKQPTISSWLIQGSVKGVRKGKLWLVERESLEEWVDELARKKAQDPDLLTTRQVAQQLGRDKRSVLQLIHTDKLPAHTVQGRIGPEFRIKRRDLEQFLEQRERLAGLLSLKEVSQQFGIGHAKVSKAARAGRLVTTRQGRNHRVERAEVERWLKQPKKKKRPEWMSDPNLLTVSQVASEFEIGSARIYKDIHGGHLAAQELSKGSGKKVFVIERKEAERCHQLRWRPRPKKGWLNIKESSERTGIPDWALMKAIKAKELSASTFRPLRGKPATYLKISELDSFAAARPTPEAGSIPIVEAAKEYGIRRGTLGKAARAGNLKARLANGRYYAKREDLEAWVSDYRLRNQKSKDLLTVPQIAERYGIRRKKVVKAIQDGHLQAAHAHTTGCGVIYGICPQEAERCYQARWRKTPEGEGWLELKQAAKQAGLGYETLYSAVRSGLLSVTRYPPDSRSLFVQASDLEHFLKAPRRGSRS